MHSGIIDGSIPSFAVTGHPNKGKSSIVSTLAMDSDVAVSDIPGTTTRSRAFPLVVDGEMLYTLYDTPGFQRPSAVLDALAGEEISSLPKYLRLRRFIEKYGDDPKFADDIELLTPVAEGSAVIYVVDGSKPYGVEFETEMEILSYGSGPSLAIINIIGDRDFSREWRVSLERHFSIVKIFDPVKADFSQIVSLLETISMMKDDWREPIADAISAMGRMRKNAISDSAAEIASAMKDMVTHIRKMEIKGKPIREYREKLSHGFRNDLVDMEKKCTHRISEIWRRRCLTDGEKCNDIMSGMELFSGESLSIFGLDRKELIAISAGAGAIAGSSIDIALGGNSLFTGTLIGTLMGVAGTIAGFDKIYDMKLMGRKVGKRYLQAGPVKDMGFVFIYLHRLLYFTVETANRPHADREAIELREDIVSGKDWMSPRERRKLHRLHRRMRKEYPGYGDPLEEYAKTIGEILEAHIEF